MLTVNDVISAAKVGELSMHHLGENSVTIENEDQWLTLLNLALINLYSRFPLKIGDTYIQQHENVHRYMLLEEYAQTNTGSAQPVKYIQDTVSNPFNPDFLRIDGVWDAYGKELVLNDEDECDSLFTPQYNMLQVPNPVDLATLNVIYRLPHPKLVKKSTPEATLAQRLELPQQFVKCLTLHMGMTAYSSMGGEQGIMGLNFRNLYESACDDIHRFNLYNQDNKSGTTPRARGWV